MEFASFLICLKLFLKDQIISPVFIVLKDNLYRGYYSGGQPIDNHHTKWINS